MKSIETRFCEYVQIDTQSDPNSLTQPSTEKQKDLSRVLVKELLEMGLKDAHLDEFGYVYATLPSNVDREVPVLCFCAHVDTSPDCTGAGVKPLRPSYLKCWPNTRSPCPKLAPSAQPTFHRLF